MKYCLTILFTFGFGHISFGQYNFLLGRKTLKEIRVIEDSLSSKYIGPVKTQVSKDYFPTAEANHDYYPITYIRTNDSFFPELHVEYFYTESDSTLLATSYDWNIMDYVKNIKTDGEKFEIEKKRNTEYLDKYNAIKYELVKKYGKPSSIEENKNDEGYFYRLRWYNDLNDILVLLKFTTQLKILPGNMKVGSFNIRVKIDYK